MYLRIETDIDLLEFGKLLDPSSPESAFRWDYENVYEWIYVDVPGYDFFLNVSREHGMADVDDELENNEQELRELVKPGPTYLFALDPIADTYVDELPESLISYICEKAGLEITVYAGRFNIDKPDPAPIMSRRPTEL